MGNRSRDSGDYRPLSAPKSKIPDAMRTQKKVHVSQFVYVGRWAMQAMTLEFGPEGSVRGFQADKIGRAFQAEAAGCVRAGAGRNMVSEEAQSCPNCSTG